MAHYLLAQKGVVVGREASATGFHVEAPLTVFIYQLPVTVEIANGHRGHHSHSLHDNAVGAVVAGNYFVGTGIGQRASYFEPLGEVVVDIESGIESGEVGSYDYTFRSSTRHSGIDGLLVAAAESPPWLCMKAVRKISVLPVSTTAEERWIG